MTTVTIKVLPTHKEALRRISEEEQEHMAVVLRRLIKEEAQRRGLWPASQSAER